MAQVPTFVVFENSSQPGTIEPNSTCLGGFVRDSNPVFDRYYLLALEYKGSDNPDFESLENCLGKDWKKIPLEYRTDAILVPTREIIIGFKPGTQEKEIAELFKKHNLVVKDQGVLGSVIAGTQSALNSGDIEKELLSSEIVEYAEVNKIVIILQ